MVTEPQPLFAGLSLDEYLRKRRMAMKAEIERLDATALAGDVSKLRQELERKYRIEPLLLGSVIEIVEHGDTVLNLTGTPQGALYNNRSRVKGSRIVFGIPFQGEREFFHCRPSTWAGTPPFFIVCERELRVVIRTVSKNTTEIRRQLDRELDNVRQHIAWITEDLRRFNASTASIVDRWMGERQKELGEKAGVIGGFGMKVRPPAAVPVPTEAAPAARAPAMASQRVRRETGPDHFTRILEKILGAVRILERNAASFRQANEGMLRDVVITALGSDYPLVTSETNCGSGRTDILVQNKEGGTLFIGECKKWKGRETLVEGINQLLGYPSWRETQAGLIVFVQNKKVSVVLEIIAEAVARHPQYKRAVPEQSKEGVLRYVFEQKEDSGREMQLAVVVLHLPVEIMKPEKLGAQVRSKGSLKKARPDPRKAG